MAGLKSEMDRLKGETQHEGLTKQEYMATHLRCAVCWWPATRRGRTLELHHICGGSARAKSDRLLRGEGWITLCSLCHRCLHDRVAGIGELPRGAVLMAKLEEDGSVDVELLASLKGRKALPYEICEIPDEFVSMRHKNGGPAWPV